jgi:hypothetical protein
LPIGNTTSHPQWCEHRDQCATRGAHCGRLVTVNSVGGDFAPVTVQLVQARLFGEPYLVVKGESGHVVMSLNQGRAVGWALAQQARAGAR